MSMKRGGFGLPGLPRFFLFWDFSQALRSSFLLSYILTPFCLKITRIYKRLPRFGLPFFLFPGLWGRGLLTKISLHFLAFSVCFYFFFLGVLQISQAAFIGSWLAAALGSFLDLLCHLLPLRSQNDIN